MNRMISVSNKGSKIEYTVCLEGSLLEAKPVVITYEGEFEAVSFDEFEDELAFSSSATSMNEVVCFYSGYQISEQILNFESIVKENPNIAKHYKGKLKQLAFLPFYHVFGLFAVYFWFTFFGRTLVFLRDYSADTILKTCRRHEVTHIFAVPMLWHTIEKKLLATVKEQGKKKQKKFEKGIKLMTQLQNICPSLGQAVAKSVMKEVTDKLFGRSVVFCINGGSYLRDTAMQLFNGIGYSLHNGYGMSEIGITSVELRKKPKFRNLNSIGRPFDSVEYRLDENSCLQVRGSSLCTKKLINGKEVKVDGWFNTGDNMIEKDGYYYILGRVGDVVIGENGENINPDVIEKLFNLASAKMLSVIGMKTDNQEELSLIVQISPYLSEEGISNIKNEIYAINETLPSAMAIRKFYFSFDELVPPTAVKVSRAQLIKKIESGEVKITPFNELTSIKQSETKESPLQRRVSEIIAEVLNISVSEVKADSHIFFDLSATSIEYFSILTKLSEEFSISSYDKNDKYCYTAKEISEYIERYL